ncbi:hypothetical protein MSEDJ_00010 [Mycolicibacterium sediminis]|uniref:Uncharacterized protein n=1 Tax=Mycolicibacterium sediminis TaxID=1286180 RepID=A0A7I7QI04_9MYCO|nr:hypothetical protein MSEDJ_00010 [Mycolicibacterium sediminis]
MVEAANWDVVPGGPAPVDQPQAWSLSRADLPLEPALPAPSLPPWPPTSRPRSRRRTRPAGGPRRRRPAARTAAEGVPLASPDALPPGSTMDPATQGAEGPNASYLKDLWQAVQATRSAARPSSWVSRSAA